MRAIILERHGGPRVLRVREVPEPRPGPGEVRVRAEAIGVNYAEALSRKGLYGWAPPPPYTLGMYGTLAAMTATGLLLAYESSWRFQGLTFHTKAVMASPVVLACLVLGPSPDHVQAGTGEAEVLVCRILRQAAVCGGRARSTQT